MLKNKITDIFFDLDHTLWDFDTNSYLAYEKLFKHYKIPVQIDDFETVYQPINKQFWEDYSKGKKSKSEVKYGRLETVFQILDIAVDKEIIIKLSEGYLDYLKEEKHLMDGAVEILDYLQPKYRLHILTNGFKEVQTDKLNNSGLTHYFDTVVSSEEVEKLKPHPDVFNYALKKAETFAHHSYMIGDNLSSDVLGARNVGMFAIHYDPDNASDIDNEIITKVKHLIEIKKIL